MLYIQTEKNLGRALFTHDIREGTCSSRLAAGTERSYPYFRYACSRWPSFCPAAAVGAAAAGLRVHLLPAPAPPGRRSGPLTSRRSRLIRVLHVCIKVAEGAHSRIFVENSSQSHRCGRDSLDRTSLINDIYPSDTSNFGSEPNPGIDNDPMITILLLNIRDGFNGSGSFTAGYFDPGNEYPLSAYPYSNQREMFYHEHQSRAAGGHHTD